MNATITLYQNADILPSKLFAVDSIGDYLLTLTSYEVKKFQYIRHALRQSIKVDLPQTNIDFSTTGYNYCKIQNGDGKVVYYFIINKYQVSANTIAFDLEMDTINTFKPAVDFTINAKTRINRQHKDRFQWKRIYNAVTETISGSVFDTGNGLALRSYYLLRKSLTAIPTPSSYLDIPTTATGVGGVLLGLTIEVYIYDPNTKVMKHYRDFDDTEATLLFTHDSNGDVYLSYGGDSFYPPDNYQFVIRWPASAGTYIGTYSTGATYQDPNKLFVGTLSADKKWYRKIDLMSEGISPLLYGSDKGQIVGDQRDWYLIYKGNNPLRCYLCSDQGFEISLGASKEIKPEDLTAGTYYYILPDRNGNYVPMTTLEGNDVSAKISDLDNTGDREQFVTVYWLDSGSIKVRRYYYRDLGLGFFYVSTLTTYTTSKIILNVNRPYIYYNESSTLTSNTGNIRQFTSGTISTGVSIAMVKSFSAVDRTDSTLVKIIKLPYRPTDDNFTGWQYDNTEKMLYKTNVESPLQRTIPVSFNPLEVLNFNYTPTGLENRDDQYESKLFHSDYYQPKCVYDSFDKVFALERVDINSFMDFDTFEFVFNCTNTINSRFLFTFTSYITTDKQAEDYPNILFIARNNECIIYNSDYINYLKTGINYDVKSKTRQEVGNWLGFGLSTIGAVASFATASTGVGIATGIAFATSAMSQLVNAVNTTAQAEANHAQRLLQLKNQKESVYGADDVDLMSIYTGNKAKMMLYEVSSRMKSLLADLFFYTGYVVGTQGVPDFTSRTRFNFVSAELEITNIKNITSDIIEDIKNKYKMGVTYIHKYNGTWNFSQDKENWEVALMN